APASRAMAAKPCVLMSASTSFTRASNSSRVAAWPKPLAAPVIRITLSFNPRSMALPRCCGGQSAIDNDFGAGDVGGLIGGQEHRGVGDVPGFPHAPHRHPLVALLDEALDAARMPRIIDMNHRR